MSGAPTQQPTLLTSSAGPLYTFSFSFVLMYLVIIDPVQQGDAQMSHPLCQVSAVPELLCGVVDWLYYLDTWILGVASKQLRLLHGRVWDSTIVVNSLSPQMSELVEVCIVTHFTRTLHT